MCVCVLLKDNFLVILIFIIQVMFTEEKIRKYK